MILVADSFGRLVTGLRLGFTTMTVTVSASIQMIKSETVVRLFFTFSFAFGHSPTQGFPRPSHGIATGWVRGSVFVGFLEISGIQLLSIDVRLV